MLNEASKSYKSSRSVRLGSRRAAACQQDLSLTAFWSAGILTADTIISEVLTPSTLPPTTMPKPSRNMSDFVLTTHLHNPALRLVYLPYKIALTFLNIPHFPEHWEWTTFVGADLTAAEALSQLIETLGVHKVALHGAKTARVEYVLQTADKGESSAREACAELTPRLRPVDNRSFHTSPTARVNVSFPLLYDRPYLARKSRHCGSRHSTFDLG